LDAFEWNKQNKEIRHLSKTDDLYFMKGTKANNEIDLKLSSLECKVYLAKLQSCDFGTLKDLVTTTHSIRVVKLNKDEWKLSECTCSDWHKSYKCHHVIATAVRMNLANFQPIFMSLPMERKITRGRKKAAKPALMRQSIDPIQAIPRLIEEASEDEDEEYEEPVAQQKKRRGRPPLNASKRVKK
jgi:hypothetical protein